jgi:itaconate CoA-transferase
VLTDIIEQAFATLSADQVVARLDAAAIANGRLNDIHALAEHPQLGARDRWRNVGTSAGEIAALLPPANLGGVDAVMGDVPTVGQHTDAVLLGIGYDREAIDDLRTNGVV